MSCPTAKPGPNRVVVSDDGHRLRLMVYYADMTAPLAVTELSPAQAMQLCAELAAAAATHVARHGA